MPQCPICGSSRAMHSVTRDALPVFQNVVHASEQEALAAPRAPFRLATCGGCGFSWNDRFDPGLVVYDARYDNHVASATFDAYYRELAAMLIARFGITDGTVYDIGCGKGEFLRVFASLAPGVRCIGVDPSCTPVREANFELLAQPFDASVFTTDARLVLLRHVLEHIDQPVGFLASLRAAMPDAPLFVEVPDLGWILKARAFWDFCYEHCNYFVPDTLAAALGAAGFRVVEQQLSFGQQYQWALAVPAAAADVRAEGAALQAAVADYMVAEDAALARFAGLADQHGPLAVWGMATKGVLFTTLLGTGRIAGGVDMNPRKQGRFAPVSGVAIHPPEWLQQLPPGTAVMAMNPNYLGEIQAAAARIRPDLVVMPA